MKVENIELEGDLGVVRAARVSFDGAVSEFTDSDKPLVKYLANHKHETPFRHGFLQFSVPVDTTPLVGDVYLNPFEKAGLHIEVVEDHVVYRNSLLGWLKLLQSGAVDVCYDIVSALMEYAPVATAAYLGDTAHGGGLVLKHTEVPGKWLDTVSLRCEAPMFIARQLGKHQTDLSWNELSRRYVDSDFEFHTPKGEWRTRPEDGIKQGSGESIEEKLGVEAEMLYRSLVDQANLIYDNLVTCKNVAPEMARMTLPQSMITKWVWSGSIAAFAHVYALRIKGNAQKEVRDFAVLMKDAILEQYPEYEGLFV